MFIKNVELAESNQQVLMCMLNAVRALLEEQRCLTCIELARRVWIAPGTILHMLKKLNMRIICARWVPHNLKDGNVWQRMETARLHLERYGREGERFLRRIITLGESWVRCYQPESKRESNEWRHNDSQRLERDPLPVMLTLFMILTVFLSLIQFLRKSCEWCILLLLSTTPFTTSCAP